MAARKTSITEKPVAAQDEVGREMQIRAAMGHHHVPGRAVRAQVSNATKCRGDQEILEPSHNAATAQKNNLAQILTKLNMPWACDPARARLRISRGATKTCFTQK